MAELKSEYIAETLPSRELLALLFVCESLRKKQIQWLNPDRGTAPGGWNEFLDRFAARLSKLPEPERVYLLGSHLQSVEEIDIYSNQIIQDLLQAHAPLIERLVKELEKDARFG